MNEFRAKLDGGVQFRVLQRIYAAADAVSRLQQRDRKSGACESDRCRDSGSSRSNDDHIRFSMVRHGLVVQKQKDEFILERV